MSAEKNRTEQTMALLKLLESFASTKTPEQTLEMLMTKSAELLTVDRGCIFLIDEEEESEMTLAYGFDKKGREPGHRVKIAEHPNLRKALKEKPVFTRCIKNGKANARLYIRLELEDETVGVMVLGARGNKERFTKDDLRIANAISNLAIKTIQTHKEIEKNIRLRTIGKFALLVVHELRNPLTAAGGFARHVLKALGKEDHSQKIKMAIVLKELGRLEKTINNTMDYIKDPKLKLTETDLNKLIKELLAANPEKIPKYIKVFFEPGEIPMSRLDKELTALAVRQILRNAKEEVGGRKEEISIRTYTKKSWIYLEIKNTGSFVTKERRETIFHPFVTEKPSGGGTGLGLSIVKTIVDKHGGQIKIRSQKNPPETTFVIKFKTV